MSEQLLRSSLSAAGLNEAAFDACFANEESLERVRKDILLGRTVGVAGTPAFFVNGQAVEAASEVEAAVAQILGGAQ